MTAQDDLALGHEGDQATEAIRAEVQASIALVDGVAERLTRLLSVTQMENLRLRVENERLKAECQTLRAENAFLHGRLAAKGMKLAQLRAQVRSFRQELIREMTYTAELTEAIEEGVQGGEGEEEQGRRGEEERGEEGDWGDCVWEDER